MSSVCLWVYCPFPCRVRPIFKRSISTSIALNDQAARALNRYNFLRLIVDSLHHHCGSGLSPPSTWRNFFGRNFTIFHYCILIWNRNFSIIVYVYCIHHRSRQQPKNPDDNSLLRKFDTSQALVVPKSPEICGILTETATRQAQRCRLVTRLLYLSCF